MIDVLPLRVEQIDLRRLEVGREIGFGGWMNVKFSMPWFDTPNFNPCLRTAVAKFADEIPLGAHVLGVDSRQVAVPQREVVWCWAVGMTYFAPDFLKSVAHSSALNFSQVNMGMKSL